MGHALRLLLVLWHYGEDTLTGHLDSGRGASNRVVKSFPFGLLMMPAYPKFKRGFNAGICPVLKKCDNRAMASLRRSGAQRKIGEPGVQVVSLVRSDTTCYGLTSVSPKFLFEALTANVMVFGNGAFGK